MPLKDKYKTSVPAPTATPAAEWNFREHPLDWIAGAAKQVGSEALGQVEAIGEGIAGTFGAQPAIAQLLGALPGSSPQQIAAHQEEVGHEHPYVKAGAELVTAGASALMGGAGSAVKTGLQLAGKVATGAAEGAGLMALYKAGEVAHADQLTATPIRAEQIQHAIFSGDTILGAFLGGAGAGLQEGLKAGKALLKGAAAKMADRQASSLFTKSAMKLGTTPSEVGQVALQKDLLKDPAKVHELRKAAAVAMRTAAEPIVVDDGLREQLAVSLLQHIKDNENNAALVKASKHLRLQARLLLRESEGANVENIIEGLNQWGSTAYTQRKGQVGAFYSQAAENLRGIFGERIATLDPALGEQYRAAVADYRVFAKMAPEAVKGAQLQFTNADAAKTVLKAAAVPLATSLLGPPGGAAVGALEGVYELNALRTGTSRLMGRNYATFADQFTKNPPFATFLRNTEKTINACLTPGALTNASSQLTSDEVEKRYAIAEQVLHGVISNPDGAAHRVRSHVDFLPGHEADAVTANTMNTLQHAAANLPGGQGPATLFGQQTGPTVHEKRQFLDHFDAKFDPYAAIRSGRADLIAEAERHHPETMAYLKQQVLDRLSQRPDIPYETRRQVTALFGICGTPLQDPTLGAHLQQNIQTSRQAHTQAGQIDSARQVRASMKQNQASLTRAQRLLQSE